MGFPATAFAASGPCASCATCAPRGADPLPPPAVAAQVEFRGFPPLGRPTGRSAAVPGPRQPLAVLLLQGGDPPAVAAWFAAALGRTARPAQFASAALAVEGIAWRPCPTAAGAAAAPVSACTYRYRLDLARGGRGSLALQCWRRYGEPIGWQRRCGPLPLRRFLEHALPRGGSLRPGRRSGSAAPPG